MAATRCSSSSARSSNTRALRRQPGIHTPATTAAVGRAALGEATARFAGQRLVTKHDADHPEAEARTGPSGMAALAALLGRELGALRLGAGAAAE